MSLLHVVAIVGAELLESYLGGSAVVTRGAQSLLRCSFNHSLCDQNFGVNPTKTDPCTSGPVALFLGGEDILMIVDPGQPPSLVTAYTGVASFGFFLSLWPAQWIRSASEIRTTSYLSSFRVIHNKL